MNGKFIQYFKFKPSLRSKFYVHNFKNFNLYIIFHSFNCFKAVCIVVLSELDDLKYIFIKQSIKKQVR